MKSVLEDLDDLIVTCDEILSSPQPTTFSANEVSNREYKCNEWIDLENTFIDFDFDKIQSFVISEIKENEKTYGFNVLLAVERSSHVWGSSHKLSDFDVKVIFYYEKRKYYSPIFKLKKQFKMIHGPRCENSKTDLDIELTFMELHYSCQMVMNNDPNMFEIFKSPIIYYIENNNYQLFCKFGNILNNIYDFNRLIVHYYSWSNGNYIQLTKMKKNRIQQKPLKVLFHILRGLLTVDWIGNCGNDLKAMKRMPLYIPTLIKEANVIDDNTKQLLLNVLNNELRQSQYQLTQLSKPLLPLIDEMLKNLHSKLPDKQASKQSRSNKSDITKQAMLEFETLVWDIIERNEIKSGKLKVID